MIVCGRAVLRVGLVVSLVAVACAHMNPPQSLERCDAVHKSLNEPAPVEEGDGKVRDALRRVDEPTRETCQCLRDHPPSEVTTFRVTFTIPEAQGEALAQDLTISGRGRENALAACYGAALARLTFDGIGPSAAIDYEFKVLPTPRNP